MLAIYDGRSHFWQWDSGQRLTVASASACEVHFRNPDGDAALTVGTYVHNGKTVADVPNILLQDNHSIVAWVYICIGDECTVKEHSFEVWPRQKPADYVYTETEVKTYKALEKRLAEIEENDMPGGAVSGAVRFDEEQSLTEEEKAQARANIGIVAYDGEYVVTPSTEDAVTLQTAQKLMDADVHVKKIPFYDVTNNQGGSTVYIGTEV